MNDGVKNDFQQKTAFEPDPEGSQVHQLAAWSGQEEKEDQLMLCTIL